jgi:hypothetical protein
MCLLFLGEGRFVIGFHRLVFFSLSESGVRCGEDGLFIGPVALLRRAPQSGGREAWSRRPTEDLDRELSDLYGWPIDTGVKRDGLAGVARALDRRDLAFAKVSALLLRLPDPPSLAKGAFTRGAPELAAQLFNSGLLKGDWDPSKHPRNGGAPNAGWFASTDGASEAADDEPRLWTASMEVDERPEPNPEPPPRSAKEIMRTIRQNLQKVSVDIFARGSLIIWEAQETYDKIKGYITLAELALEVAPEALSLMSRTDQRSIQEGRTALDPPKTIDELEKQPDENRLGYQLHHIVEQNPANLAKSPIEILIEKFGRDVIDSPSNLVWVPRLKHELITA